MEVEEILKKVREGKLTPKTGAKEIRIGKIRKLGQARLDLGRVQRAGVPEIVLAEGKTIGQLKEILKGFEGLVSRLEKETAKKLRKNFKFTYVEDARIGIFEKLPKVNRGTVAVVTAGTSDVAVAEEAAVVARALGCRVLRFFDVGVAGIERLVEVLPEIMEADVVVVVAGREGTLPGVIAGLVPKPVIGVPTSTGYGFGGKGEAALKAMLQSCSFITVVNIDNGVGAGACAALMCKAARHC